MCRGHNSPIGIFLNHLKQLKGLKYFTGHVLGSYTVVGRTHAVSLTTSIDLGHGAYTSTPTKVQVADCGCCWIRDVVTCHNNNQDRKSVFTCTLITWLFATFGSNLVSEMPCKTVF